MESWKTQTVPITDNECHNMQTLKYVNIAERASATVHVFGPLQ